MSNIIQALDTPGLIAALEHNLEEEMLCFGRSLSGGEIYNDGELEGFFTGKNHLNGILRTHLRKGEIAYVEESIKRIQRYFQERNISQIVWSTGQNCQPENIGDILEKYGFQKLPEENAGMALAIEQLQVEDLYPAGLEIREITDLAGLEVLRKLEVQGFGSSESMAQNYYEMYANSPFGPGKIWRHFGGWWNGEAVASTSLLFDAGVAGIFGVATIPEARRRGIARAMVVHVLAVARDAGYHIAVLSPTEMSAGIYRRLGFREYTRIHHYSYEW